MAAVPLFLGEARPLHQPRARAADGRVAHGELAPRRGLDLHRHAAFGRGARCV